MNADIVPGQEYFITGKQLKIEKKKKKGRAFCDLNFL